MATYYDLILDIMNERQKTIKDLEDNKILGKNTFYSFRRNDPSLKSLIEISNFLEVPIDYLIGKTTDSTPFKKYKLKQSDFYNKLEGLIRASSLSRTKLCNELDMTRKNLLRWKNGTTPTISKLMALANYFQCNIDDLLDHDKSA